MIQKFRAYLKDRPYLKGTGVIVDVQEINYKYEEIIYKNGKYMEVADFKDVILLQSTRFKDKNDTEIFEGDVLKYWGECRPVVFKESSFGWVEGGDYIPFSMICISEIGNAEVIGNIYENGDLLK